MSKLTEVEAALIRIEPTKFQQFGDDYLRFAEPAFPDIQRFGTQKGKVKPKKGHPDSYYRTDDGKYVFIEYTTMQKDRSGKALLEKIALLTNCLKGYSLPFSGIDTQYSDQKDFSVLSISSAAASRCSLCMGIIS
jgi:hypothetical protein